MSIDYTSYSDDTKSYDATIEDPVEVIEEDVVSSSEDITMMGVIANSKKVYLRRRADKDSDPVTIMDEDDEVMIDGTSDDSFGNGWYHVITANSNEGYVMSDYVKLVK